MDSAIDISTARELVSDRVLWPLVRDFLWDFAPQIHPSWLEGFSPVERKVDSWILRELGVVPCFHTFPKGDLSRLMLVDGGTLMEISRWLGAISCAGRLRRITGGAAVRALKGALPGVYPGVFAYTMYFRQMADEGGSGEVSPDEVVATGVAMLKSYAAKLQEPLKRRFALKLPKPGDGVAASDVDGRPPINLQLLLKLRFPEVHSLCF